MIEVLVQLLEGSILNNWILSTAWFWPSLEIFHFIGLSLLLGSMLIIDIRLAGFVRRMNVMATHRLLPLAGVGFFINLATGMLFFIVVCIKNQSSDSELGYPWGYSFFS
jgi:hypothetical protein